MILMMAISSKVQFLHFRILDWYDFCVVFSVRISYAYYITEPTDAFSCHSIYYHAVFLYYDPLTVTLTIFSLYQALLLHFYSSGLNGSFRFTYC